MFYLFHKGVYNGAGTLNANKDGSPKSILIGSEIRNRTSSQKTKRGYRDGLRELGFSTCTQTRELSQELIPLAKRSSEKTDDLATIFCRSLMEKFLGHSTKKAEEKSNGKKSKKSNEETSEGKEKDIEVARITHDEIKSLKQIATRRGKGEDIDVEKLTIDRGDYEIDLALFGRMRPTPITGLFKVAGDIGVHPVVSEKDFFIASDDLLKKGSPKGNNSHLGDRWLSSYLAYGYAELNVDELLKYFKNDKSKTNEAIEACVKLVLDYAPKSNANGSPNQGRVFYLMVEKTDRPRSLEIAFQTPADNSEEFVSSIRNYKEALDDFDGVEKKVEHLEMCAIPSLKASTRKEVIDFLKIR